MEMSDTEMKDSESEGSPQESENLNNEHDESDELYDFAMENNHNDIDRTDDQLLELEVNNKGADSDQNDTNENIPRLRKSEKSKQVEKTPVKKGQKRKSTSNETPAKSKLPKFEAMNVDLVTKTINIKGSDASKYKALDRNRLTTIPTKEGTFQVGDLIWAKMVGYPWWPCMVSVDPETGNYSKITGASCKADRVYHVQYFGPEAYRGWTTIGMAMPFEGFNKFYDRINEEIENLPKKRMSKVLEKCSVKPSYKKKWNESISEAEKALNLSKRERVTLLTFNYVIGTEQKESKSRKSTVSVDLNHSINESIDQTISNLSNSKPIKTNSAKSTKKVTRRVSTSNKKANKSTEDVYDFDEDSNDFDNEPLPGLVFRKRCPKGDFQVYLRKHFDDEAKENPDRNKSEISELLKNKWEDMTEDMRSIYIERKAIYEDESNMIVAKRSNFGDDYYNDDSDYDYNDSDMDDSQNRDKSNSFSTNNNSNSKPKRSKSKKSEKLFDKIKNDDTPVKEVNETPKVSNKRKSIPTVKVKVNSDVTASTPLKDQSEKTDTKANSARKATNSIKSDKKTKEVVNIETKKKLCLTFEESSDDTNSDSASLNDAEPSSRDSKKVSIDRFCFVCGDDETPDESIVVCEGICRRMYHKKCIQHTNPGNKFCCEECKTNKHKCFACNSATDLDTKKCEDNKCGRFYHLSCIENNFPIRVNESANSFLCPLHTCLTCHLETLDDNEYRANNKKLVRCIHCPTAYHARDFCIAAGTVRVSKNYVICPEHYQTQPSKSKDRHINVNYCFACLSGGNLICCESCPAAFHGECLEYTFDADKSFYCSSCTTRKQLHYGDIVWVKLGSYRWWPGKICHPNIVPENVLNLSHNYGDFPVYFFGSHDYYWVNKGRAYLCVEGDNQAARSNVGNKSGSSKSLKNAFKNALQEAEDAFGEWHTQRREMVIETIANKPPPYQNIMCNKYLTPKSNGNGNCSEANVHICECKEGNEESRCADETCLNRISLIECDPKFCSCRDKCKNQRFRKNEYAKCKPFKTKAAGWGLMALEDIKEGQFVIEYAGEIIDEQECSRRLQKIASTQSNFYFLNLDKDLFIDAGPKGNLARFMNHSCEPNCITQKWVVGNYTRIGLFALRDIPSGTELTFNYNLDCRGNERIKCECGSSKCSGFIGDRPKNEDAQNKRLMNGSKQKNGKQKNSKKKTLTFNKMHENVCFKCGEPGKLIMCETKGCPKSYHLACINLIDVPHNAWICPRHTCMKDTCNEPAFALCSVCPNSLCKTHASQSNSLSVLPDDQFLCEDHKSSCLDELVESELNGMEENKED